MNALMSPYQLVLISLLAAWFVTLVLIWVRYERLPHAAYTLLAILLWPALIADELIHAMNWHEQLFFLLGFFQFAPALMVTLFYLSLHKLVIEKPHTARLVLLSPTAVMFVCQLPFILLVSAEQKYLLALSEPAGNLLVYWPVYLMYGMSGFVVLILAFQVEKLVSNYRKHLSDQVVDVEYYKLSATSGLFGSLISVAFVSIILTSLIAFDLVQFAYWQASINLVQAIIFLILLFILLERRRYAPSPLNYELMAKHKYSDQYLRDVLTKTEQAIIKYKAYKKIGLRIGQLAEVADVDPQALAVATRSILNRNFRAFIYHYRLEYAKKVLMRTDAKVASVAKRLGFNSEKFLSGIFVKYIQKMGDKDDI